MWPNASTGTELWIGLRRRWWLIIGLPVLTAGLTLARPPHTAPVVEARLTVAVDVKPDSQAANGSVGTAAEIGEALVDDLSRILPGDSFAKAVTERLPAGRTVQPGEIQGSVSSEDRHRVTDITVRRALAAEGRSGAQPGASPGVPSDASTSAEAVRQDVAAIAAAVAAELNTNGSRWSSRLGTDGAVFSIVDGPHVAVGPRPLADRLALPLRVLVALLIALALAAALHAADTRLHSAADATAATFAPVLATVPRRARSARRPTKDGVVR